MLFHEDGGPGCVKVSIIHKHSCCQPTCTHLKAYHWHTAELDAADG